METYDDDVAPPNASNVSAGKKPAAVLEAGRTQVRIIKKAEAAFEETKMKVLVELRGSGDIKGRSPLDLVVVLDLSESTNDINKLIKLTDATSFLISKLSLIDRLSIVTFSSEAHRLFPLTDEKSQDDIIQLVDEALNDVAGNTNIAAGLTQGLKVLTDRRFNQGRFGAIMLISDGEQNAGDDATQLQIHQFPVHTFGFGADHEARVLQDIARKSKGGTFSDVRNENNLIIALSQCLGGLLTVVAHDLNLTITQVDKESKIENVSAGDYKAEKNKNGSVTISFGDLYNKEARKVIVDLLLPAVNRRSTPDVFVLTYTYSTGKGKNPFVAPPITASITRTKRATRIEREEVEIEEKRLKTVNMVKEARIMADNMKLEEAKDKVVEAENMLADIEVDDEPNKDIEMLKCELQQLFKLMKTQDMYDNQGRSYALSFETSHDLQRYAARGDRVEKLQLFATPRMDTYLEQAKEFKKDPTNPPPSVEDDINRERVVDPLEPIAGALSFFLKTAIQALISLDKKIANRRV